MKTDKPDAVRRFILKDHDGVVDYEVIHEEFGKYESRTTMYRSKGSHWTKPGELLLQIVDDGNGIKVKKWHSPNRKRELDYGVFAEMIVFLRTFLKACPCLTGGFIAEEVGEEKI